MPCYEEALNVKPLTTRLFKALRAAKLKARVDAIEAQRRAQEEARRKARADAEAARRAEASRGGDSGGGG